MHNNQNNILKSLGEIEDDVVARKNEEEARMKAAADRMGELFGDEYRDQAMQVLRRDNSRDLGNVRNIYESNNYGSNSNAQSENRKVLRNRAIAVLLAVLAAVGLIVWAKTGQNSKGQSPAPTDISMTDGKPAPKNILDKVADLIDDAGSQSTISKDEWLSQFDNSGYDEGGKSIGK